MPVAVFLLFLALSATGADSAAQTPEKTVTEPPATERDEPPVQDKPPPAPPPEADDSPFDYKSSEKISEDLSVSFPVDI
jgi:hypothetical protein